jgi:hypothetical protein
MSWQVCSGVIGGTAASYGWARTRCPPGRRLWRYVGTSVRFFYIRSTPAVCVAASISFSTSWLWAGGSP